MFAQGQPLQQSKLISPFEQGVSFAALHVRELLLASVPPALIGIVILYFRHFFPLTHQQLFLVAVLSFASATWLLLTTFLLMLRSFQTGGRPVKVAELSWQALIFLPKTFVSYLMLFLLVMGMFLVPWLLPIAPVLFWAPLFCAGELLSRSTVPSEDEDEFDEEPRRLDQPPARPKFFTDRAIWDLGFSRSIAFAMKNKGVTVQVSILLVVSLILPKAAVVFVAGYYYGFAWEVVEQCLSEAMMGLLFGIIAATFLFLLPREAHDEIGFPPEPPTSLRAMVSPLYRRGWLFLSALIAMAVVGAIPVWFAVVSHFHKPPAATVTVEKVEIKAEQVAFSVLLNDPVLAYRWLDPKQFRLVLFPVNDPAASAATPVPTPVPTPAATPAPALPPTALPEGSEAAAPPSPKPDPNQPTVIDPDRVSPLTQDGQPLSEDNFAPYHGPLRLAMTFPLPEKKTIAGMRYALFYISPLDRGEKMGEYAGERFVEGVFDENGGR